MQARGGAKRGDASQRRTSVKLEDVARAAGVHYSTVSRALDPDAIRPVNLETRLRIQAVARRLGYRRDLVASGLKRGKSQTVAVIVGDLTNLNVPPVLRGIANHLEPVGLMALVAETQDDSQRLRWIIEHLLSRRVDAFMLTAARLADVGRLRWIKRQGVPVILAVQNVPGAGLPACTYDELMGGRIAAEHLLSLGHRRLAQLRGPEDIFSTATRAQGFSKAVKAAGAAEVTLRLTAPTGSVTDGYRMMRALLAMRGRPPTGVFVHHDLMAIGAMEALDERGLKCPDDISLIGYHDLPHMERLAPPLTSIRLPRAELGREAAEMLLERMTWPDRRLASRKVPPSLVIRASTAPPR